NEPNNRTQEPDQPTPRPLKQERVEAPALHSAAIKRKESDEALPSILKRAGTEASLTTGADNARGKKPPTAKVAEGKTSHGVLETVCPHRPSRVALWKIPWGPALPRPKGFPTPLRRRREQCGGAMFHEKACPAPPFSGDVMPQAPP
ncbi:hypothetical protein DQ04_26251000, partial [Trypanosoma grayi]|uniref:hypothetical protein n=1 Tax=Trypanosoma grayi TaxID=71804 RepID=UPI0004F46FE1